MSQYSTLSHHFHVPKLIFTFLILINHVTLISSTSRQLLQSPSPSIAPSDDQANTDFIKTSCVSTTYPELCFATLSVYASKIQTSPRLLAMASLSESLKTVRSTVEAISELSGATAREAAALSDCAEELSDTADELQRSISEMGEEGGPGSGPEFRLRMSNIRTWVSAALTDEDTCVDGFSGSSMNGRTVKSEVRGHIANVAHMTSNALALVNHFASTSH